MISSWCHHSHHCICCFEIIVQRSYMAFGAVLSTSADISAMCHWQCCWCHVMPILMASHNQKAHVASQFDYPDLQNTMVTLMTPLTSSDASTGTNGVTSPEKSCCPSFWSSWPNKCYGATDDVMGIMWCWCKSHHMSKKVMFHLNLIALT